MEMQITPLLIVVSIINISAFLIMFWDKTQSRQRGAERISEGILFFMVLAFGAIGVYAGMMIFRHKTRKWYFIAGVPLAMIENYATYILIHQLFVQ